MTSSPEHERDYLLRRCADHLALAERYSDDGRKALHQRFASLYRARADAIPLVDED